MERDGVGNRPNDGGACWACVAGGVSVGDREISPDEPAAGDSVGEGEKGPSRGCMLPGKFGIEVGAAERRRVELEPLIGRVRVPPPPLLRLLLRLVLEEAEADAGVDADADADADDGGKKKLNPPESAGGVAWV